MQLKYVVPSEMSKLKDLKSKDSLSFFGFLDTDGQYPVRDYQEALGISGKVTYLSIYYNVPGMIDLYKSGVTNTEIMQGEILISEIHMVLMKHLEQSDNIGVTYE